MTELNSIQLEETILSRDFSNLPNPSSSLSNLEWHAQIPRLGLSGGIGFCIWPSDPVSDENKLFYYAQMLVTAHQENRSLLLTEGQVFDLERLLLLPTELRLWDGVKNRGTPFVQAILPDDLLKYSKELAGPEVKAQDFEYADRQAMFESFTAAAQSPLFPGLHLNREFAQDHFFDLVLTNKLGKNFSERVQTVGLYVPKILPRTFLGNAVWLLSRRIRDLGFEPHFILVPEESSDLHAWVFQPDLPPEGPAVTYLRGSDSAVGRIGVLSLCDHLILPLDHRTTPPAIAATLEWAGWFWAQRARERGCTPGSLVTQTPTGVGTQPHFLATETLSASLDLTLAPHLGLDLLSDLNQPRFRLPAGVTRVKLDVGLSHNAPHSNRWLRTAAESGSGSRGDLFVFGFEPNAFNYQTIRHRDHALLHSGVQPQGRFRVLPVALNELPELSESGQVCPFFATGVDPGCSSLGRPVEGLRKDGYLEYPVSETQTSVFTLSDFFFHFPWDQVPVIEYVKIDAQGYDLRIAKSAGRYLSERVVVITLEPEILQYEGCDGNTPENMEAYLTGQGFVRLRGPPQPDGTWSSTHFPGCSALDPTYLNTRYAEYPARYGLTYFQS